MLLLLLPPLQGGSHHLGWPSCPLTSGLVQHISSTLRIGSAPCVLRHRHCFQPEVPFAVTGQQVRSTP